ncbi:hypothetical protein L228DRAFT_249276 [Xylona heveae TC161]|uniref:Uncharacterized protein n=1 Tax=Xylona heveae (strain CBS 132557 / TC161) TaxID=1328760 RepID=A0A165AI82_XYLHT|nr:hypothetical protein L228DRAFT_249276 [Xylona heveae TC161]KZF20519.1 hypothetical protein L228DRAFT_249276 [Xylona heveae TC161]
MSRVSSLTAEALARLESIGLPAKPTPIKGWRSISGSSWKTISSGSSRESIVIPEFIESMETLQYLGFTKETAEKLWLKIEKRPDPDMNDFMRMVRGWVRSFPNAVDEDDDWISVMNKIGIKTRLRQAILTPEYKDIRLSETCHYWINETMQCDFQFLESISNRILQKITSLPSLSSGGETMSEFGPASPPPSAELFVEPYEMPASAGRVKGKNKSRAVGSEYSARSFEESPTKKPKLDPDDPFSSTKLDVSSAAPEKPKEPTIVLYKGGDLVRLESALTLEPNKKGLLRIMTHPPTDLSSLELRLYFTSQHEIAEKYAGYAHVRNEGGRGAGILHAEIPTRFLADIVDIYGEEWREFVWCCRQIIDLPDHLEYLAHQPVIRAPSWLFPNAKAQKPTTTKADVLPFKLDGNNTASQIAFTVARVNEMDKDVSVWIEKVGKNQDEKS